MAEAGLDLGELRESVRELLAAESDPRAVLAMADRGERFDRALWVKMAALGWLGLPVAEEHGGLGLGFAEAAVVIEELGRALSLVPALGTLLATQAIGTVGEADAKAAWLPALASGLLTAAVALPQEGAARLSGDLDGGLSGTAADVLGGDLADLLLLPVAGGLAVFVSSDAGVSVEPCAAIDLTRTLARVEVRGAKPKALLPMSQAQLDALTDQACVALACDSVGGAGAILERTVDYMRTRVQFDRPIGSFQALKHRAATWKVLLEAATALARHAAQQVASGAPQASATAASAKVYACDAYAAIAGDAVQLHGGIGFTWEHECHLFLKRAKLNQALLGHAAQHQDRAARLLFAEPA